MESGWIVISGYFFRIGDSENCVQAHSHSCFYLLFHLLPSLIKRCNPPIIPQNLRHTCFLPLCLCCTNGSLNQSVVPAFYFLPLFFVYFFHFISFHDLSFPLNMNFFSSEVNFITLVSKSSSVLYIHVHVLILSSCFLLSVGYLVMFCKLQFYLISFIFSPCQYGSS